jgi:hypothetical protein
MAGCLIPAILMLVGAAIGAVVGGEGGSVYGSAAGLAVGGVAMMVLVLAMAKTRR